jgi:hypothetical protein
MTATKLPQPPVLYAAFTAQGVQKENTLGMRLRGVSEERGTADHWVGMDLTCGFKAEIVEYVPVIRRAGLGTEYDALRLATKELLAAIHSGTCVAFSGEGSGGYPVEIGEHVELVDIKTQLEKLEALL